MTQKIFDYDAKGILAKADITGKKKPGSEVYGRLFVLGPKAKKKDVIDQLKSEALAWHLKRAQKKAPIARFSTDKGPVWIIQPEFKADSEHAGLLEKSPYGLYRDLVGSHINQIKVHELEEVHMEFIDASDEEIIGSLAGIEIGSYKYRSVKQPKDYALKNPKFFIKGVSAAIKKEAIALGTGVNVARHLVNTPPDACNPTDYAKEIKKLFAGIDEIKVETWAGKRLEKENMNLLIAVGKGSDNGPCMVHIKYTPKGKKNKQPYAFVGKGITFDTGGLDIKPSAGMRNMKKDMGGSASLVGFAQWLHASDSKAACDIYLAIAENSIDERAFRPSDIITSRNGLTVEIHNTDAEGRLVLADVLDVAANKTGAQAPEFIVDLATLTGAMRVGLGIKVAGLFSNNDSIADALIKSGQRMSDGLWRMPLLMEMKSALKSNFANISNCAISPFGGAITAAIFLSKFIGDKPWIHIDMMAWTEISDGALSESGGNGQVVQALADFVTRKITK